MTLCTIYTLMDVKSAKFGPVMTFANDELAIRSFCAMISSPDKDSLIALYPQDYSLYSLAVYDNDTGEIRPEVAPRLVLTALQGVKRACEDRVARNNIRKMLDDLDNNNNEQSDLVVNNNKN
ncbi:nonstructural protein [Sigmofec virus UA08Rod_6143]|uniref:Nonstructural protein n=1 Tax=Sigmofec virus UA08Rod_6143 TaxID=2929223 RepID=A0A976R6U5_9VIRU|nr:nonstructural protein [Sigmofec virus UA08Rod_6143]